MGRLFREVNQGDETSVISESDLSEYLTQSVNVKSTEIIVDRETTRHWLVITDCNIVNQECHQTNVAGG